VRGAERDSRHEVVGHLGHDPGPVDGVDARQLHPVAEGVIVEHPLHESLAVIERAVDGNRMDIPLTRRGHHAPLHVGNPPSRIEDHHVDCL